MGDLLAGKNVIVMGVANERSIAWAIAQSLAEQGARLAFTYESERVEGRVRKLAETIPGSLILPCNVTVDEEIDRLADTLKSEFGVLHGLVHSIAFAKGEDLAGEFMDTSREGFALANDISVYSLVAVSKRLSPLMTEGGSIMTMTYMGSERVMRNYNVMGVAKAGLEASVRYLANDLGPKNIRVNAISAGPIRTLAAKGISDFNSILKQVEEKAPLRKTTDTAEVGDTAMFLISHLSRGITGEVIFVDGGYNIVGA
ncbi:enoyl-ACP reductase FabI [Paenibacillus phoenicis]|jgi:enoyl-[acyl-carrier protein] reductase I|uniref:Enoyl-[acyl-carrier-protein] reductase [NADH] n=3 Tax=Paenibacillus TaxID=44249 RepID=R9LG36_9BACL|nr:MULTISPECIES: enoyl-ACP reductase FabI [Paenibacillus]EOS54712.1 enoyl-[acyl-carrier protein] reductase I [Paenibacillus barengoltzii G22]MDU0330970.1 enoyl-ACP reductase FabI [Paenibacillus sp. 3LSP]MEA3572451.1 enoyl-ACP reductase FabI [Paenibacillus phoenicis]MEC2345270.1 enoyl-ACP reductase FabI [Paenibacillus barengoltzii]SMF12605.1 Enoyl-[acyl-carrier-protein] reductase [NADH] [Paenibacillus barengoltzii J12]